MFRVPGFIDAHFIYRMSRIILDRLNLSCMWSDVITNMRINAKGFQTLINRGKKRSARTKVKTGHAERNAPWSQLNDLRRTWPPDIYYDLAASNEK